MEIQNRWQGGKQPVTQKAKCKKININVLKSTNMTAADMLRQELKNELPFTKKDFIDALVASIREYGKSTWYCNDRVCETNLRQREIHLKHERILTQYAEEEGFMVFPTYNMYGVRILEFSI